jgi:hypothetical protein
MTAMQMPLLPLEIINHIFSYCEGSCNQIMKKHCSLVEYYDSSYIYKQDHLLFILKANRRLGFKHFNEKRYRNAYYYTCDYCNCYLTTENYTKYYFENLRFCSDNCEYLYDVKYVDIM